MTDLALRETAIPGLLVLDLAVHGDARGWFKENWQRAKMTGLGLPDFGPVQQNMSYNAEAGVTRGLHAEPWDKLVSVASGRVFGAWVDLREGPAFGTLVCQEIGPDTAVFVPSGVANGYQALEPGTVYSYLVNAHWSARMRDRYTYVNLADRQLAVPWPIPLEQATVSDADRAHPGLAEVRPMPPRRPCVIGVGGQLANALLARLPGAQAIREADLDITDAGAVERFDFSMASVIYNAAAYTDVDAAETPGGRRRAWAVNATGVGHLAAAARRQDIPLVHFSSDYVFDGTQEEHTEDEPLTPLGVYGQTKAAGDLLAATAGRHYVLRTTWLIGDGENFVRTMARLAARGVRPAVVDDQVGRLTFTGELARAACHLVEVNAPSGVYNVTGSGRPMSWFEIARSVYREAGFAADAVSPCTTQEYGRGKTCAPRPANSVMALDRLEATGFHPLDHETSLSRYMRSLSQEAFPTLR